MKYIDAHIHLNMKAKDPVRDLVENLRQAGCSGAVLILNSDAEKECFFEHCDELPDSGLVWHIGMLVDLDSPHKNETDYFSVLKRNFLPYSVKLHSRISRLSIGDIPAILSQIRNMEQLFENIIVDGFYYGSRIENCISLELVIAAARAFPEKTVVYSHSGGIHILETLVHLRDLPNIVYDFSLSCNYLRNTSVYPDFVQILRFNKTKVMFGSDHPDFSIPSALKTTGEMADDAGLSSSERESLFCGNAMKYYSFRQMGSVRK